MHVKRILLFIDSQLELATDGRRVLWLQILIFGGLDKQ
jgi:hypothetical protein